MTRNRAWRRYKDYVKAKRKQNIDRHYAGHTWYHPWYQNLHQYSKNKIHCSCPLCACKTKNKHHKKPYYGPTWNPTMMDLRRHIAMDEDEQSFEEEILFENL